MKKKNIEGQIKKIEEENEIEYNRWCNRDKIDKMTEQLVNWKVKLVFLENNLQ